MNELASVSLDDALIWFFCIGFTLAAFVTRKDLAFLLCAVNWFTVGVWFEALSSGWSQYQMITAVAFANFIVLVVAAHHWYRYGKKPLARFITWTSWLCSVAASLNVFGLYDVAKYSLSAFQLLALIACFMVDGHKELLNDVARWSAGHIRYRANHRSHNSSN